MTHVPADPAKSTKSVTEQIPKKVLTLVLVHESPRILLGMKKKGFGEGKWNGFGGKLQPGESIEEAAHRELMEEAGITVKHLEKAGMFTETFGDDPTVLEGHIFRASGISGELTESDEMRPQWFDEALIPFDQMWEPDRLWYPYFLRGEQFHAEFYFADMDTLVSSSIETLEA